MRRLRTTSRFLLRAACTTMTAGLFALGAGGTAAAQSPTTGSAILAGTVMVEPSEKPLANAEVVFTKLSLTARTDSAGNFVIQGVPPGSHEVMFRLLGYESITTLLTFDPGQKLEGDFLLKPSATTLDRVDVKAAATSTEANDILAPSVSMREFEERRKDGVGRFITQEVFVKARGRLVSDIILSKVPGVHANAIGGSSDKALASGRNSVSLSGGIRGSTFDNAKPDCYIQVMVNGLVMYRGGGPLYNINAIDSSQLYGLEYYTVAQTPTRFQSTGSQCGTLLLWTRAR